MNRALPVILIGLLLTGCTNLNSEPPTAVPPEPNQGKTGPFAIESSIIYDIHSESGIGMEGSLLPYPPSFMKKIQKASALIGLIFTGRQ